MIIRLWCIRNCSKFSCVLLALACLSLSLPLEAQQRDPARAIKKSDHDGDSRISPNEWRGSRESFLLADADSDGFVTQAELKRHWTGQQQAKGQNPAVSRSKEVEKCLFEKVTASNDDFHVDAFAPDCVFEGTTLFAWNKDPTYPEILEVDMRGEVVWVLSVRDALDDVLDADASGPATNQRLKPISVMDVEKLPNGNILFNVRNVGGFEVTGVGEIVWQHLDEEMSHDLDRLPNGNTIYVRGWARRGDDHVREVTRAGRTVWAWNGLAHYDREPFRGVEIEGWLHSNSVTRIANGNTFISIRNLDRTIEVAPDGQTVSETIYRTRPREGHLKSANNAMGMSISRPHDPEILPGGSIIVAHPPLNRVVIQPIGTSKAKRILRWDRAADYLHLRDVNRLPNGNLLLVGFNRIFELNPRGLTVWSLRVPGRPPMVSSSNKKRLRGIEKEDLFKAQRIGPDGKAYGG